MNDLTPGKQVKQAALAKSTAILIDGAFFLKRFFYLYGKDHTPVHVANKLYTIAHGHVKDSHLYRIFYYDAPPLDNKFHNPVSKKSIDLSKSDTYKFRINFFEELKRKRKLALRLGTVKTHNQWIIRPGIVKLLLNGAMPLDELKETDVELLMTQKGIDMKIGVDIASLAFKRLVDRIVLISGDSDFVPAAKLARREGIDFILDPMHANVEPSLHEHIDGLKNCSLHPNMKNSAKHSYKAK